MSDRRTETRYLLVREQWSARGEAWEDKSTLQVELIDSGPDRGQVQIAVLSERRRGAKGAAGSVHWDQAAIRLGEAAVRRLHEALGRVLSDAVGGPLVTADADAQPEARAGQFRLPEGLPTCPLGAYEKLRTLWQRRLP